MIFLTTHTEVNTSDTLARYFKVAKAVLDDPLDEFLPIHLIKDHHLDVVTSEYGGALRAHRLALGEGDASLRKYLVDLSRKHPDVPDKPEEVVVYNSAKRNRSQARARRRSTGRRGWAPDVTGF